MTSTSLHQGQLGDTDRFAAAREIADAVCCEGYVLYPYRASSGKNVARWQFGVLAPRDYAVGSGSESFTLRAEFLMEGRASRVRAVVRFLQVQARTVHRTNSDGGDVLVASLETPDGTFTTFDEAVEHEVELCDGTIEDLMAGEVREMGVPGGEDDELVAGGAARIRRTRWPLRARTEVTALPCEGPYGLIRLRIVVENLTRWEDPCARRDAVMRSSLLATHMLAAVDGGRFLSKIEPPEFAREESEACTNVGTFPVLVGADAGDDVVLSAPIILYDHPEVAPESQADFCDATEMDEMLALRVMTLTDEEKREARATDPRAAALVDLCDHMPPEMLDRLHGAIRSLRSIPSTGSDGEIEDADKWWDPEADARLDPFTDSMVIAGAVIAKGSKVTLRPGRRADAQDLFLAGKRATVSGLFSDVDGAQHVAVTVDDDPAADLHDWYGRYLYFDPTEIEPVASANRVSS